MKLCIAWGCTKSTRSKVEVLCRKKFKFEVLCRKKSMYMKKIKEYVQPLTILSAV